MSHPQTAACVICHQTSAAAQCAASNRTLNALAEGYIKLVLAIGCHQPLYVDAYYGPADWQAQASLRPLTELVADSASLRAECDKVSKGLDCQALIQRHRFLTKQLTSVASYLTGLMGESLSFDQESLALYDAKAPKHQLSHFSETLAELDRLLPGEGSLTSRFEAYRRPFIVPFDKVPQVFTAAVEQARAVTRQHIVLPEEERFRVEFVKDKIWTAYNWYQGDYTSLIQLNQDHPLYLERAMELSSHEGYPGHHLFNLLQERDLVKGLGWMEYAVYPLYSPISFLSEGSANYGLSLLMSKAEIIAFEREVLMPLAGIEGDIHHYHRVMDAYKGLAHLDELVCRQFIDGEIDADQAAQMLVEFGLYSSAKAAQRVDFYRSNRSYVINYHFGEASVGEYVTSQARDTAQAWKVFTALLARPRAASEIIPILVNSRSS